MQQEHMATPRQPSSTDFYHTKVCATVDATARGVRLVLAFFGPYHSISCKANHTATRQGYALEQRESIC